MENPSHFEVSLKAKCKMVVLNLSQTPLGEIPAVNIVLNIHKIILPNQEIAKLVNKASVRLLERSQRKNISCHLFHHFWRASFQHWEFCQICDPYSWTISTPRPPPCERWPRTWAASLTRVWQNAPLCPDYCPGQLQWKHITLNARGCKSKIMNTTVYRYLLNGKLNLSKKESEVTC